MPNGRYRFDAFELDLDDRRLTRGGAPVALNARYLDALALLAAESGRLVGKDRFMAEVWQGTPVTDEALTQCIRVLRRQLGDEAGNPRYIETVPKHGYRFIAAVERVAAPAGDAYRATLAQQVLAATLGGGAAGALGGLAYGLIATAQSGPGQVSALLVMILITALVGLAGGAAVGLGAAAAGKGPGRPVLGAALGGLAVGTAARFLGQDAFSLLLGRSPGEITGPFEGLVLGAATGLAIQFSALPRRPLPAFGLAAASGAVGGLLVALMGGRLMAGSLASLAQHFPGSRLALPPLSAIFTAPLEGLLFALGVALAMRRVHATRARA